MSAEAQSRRNQDIVVLNDGLVMKGKISEKSWRTNPTAITFRPVDTRKKVRISATEIKEITLSDGPYFRKVQVKINPKARQTGVYARPDIKQFLNTELLLRRIGDGENDLYIYRYGKTQLYFVESGDSLRQLEYLKLGDERDFRTVDTEHQECMTTTADLLRYRYKDIIERYARAEECGTGTRPKLVPEIAPSLRLSAKTGLMKLNYRGSLAPDQSEFFEFNLPGTYDWRFDLDLEIGLMRRPAASLYYVIGGSVGQASAMEDNPNLGALWLDYQYRALRLGFRYEAKLSKALSLIVGRTLVLDNIANQGFSVPGNNFILFGFRSTLYDMPREYQFGLSYKDRFLLEYSVRSPRDLRYDGQFSSASDAGHSFLIGYRL